MHPIHRSEYFEPMSFFYGGISCFFHMNKDFFYWKTEKMPLENLWQFQKQNFEEIFKKHPLIVFRNNKKYIKSKKKQLSKLLKLSSHPIQYLTLSLRNPFIVWLLIFLFTVLIFMCFLIFFADYIPCEVSDVCRYA